MRKLTLIPLFDIQLFGEGAGGAGGGTGAGDAGGAPAGQNAAVAQPQSGVNSRNPLADVQYGIQDAPAAGEKDIAPDNPDAEFEELIKGKFKAQYDQRVQDTIRRRLKGSEDTVNKYNALSPVLDMLAQKYGVDATDAEALAAAIEDDESFYEDEALERGLTVEQVKEIRKMERENAQLKAEREAQRNQQLADQTYAAWLNQAEELKGIYPSFDLPTELDNEQFRNLLRSNVDMRTAYEVIHKDEIIPMAMKFTAEKVTEKVANSVRAGQRRPSEGAMSGSATAVIKSDVSQLTRKDRDEIDRRVARGEKIRF